MNDTFSTMSNKLKFLSLDNSRCETDGQLSEKLQVLTLFDVLEQSFSVDIKSSMYFGKFIITLENKHLI